MAPEPSPPAELSCRDDGQGPPVVLLHGVGGDRLIWNEVATSLSRAYRVIIPDLRGHGRSPAPPGSEFTLAEMAGDLLHLLDEKKVDSAHWVGLSAGGFLALRLTLDHPERTRSLALVSSAAYLDAHSQAVMERWWSTSAEEGPDAFALRLLKDVYYPDWVEAHIDVVDQVNEEARSRDYRSAVAWGRSLRGFDERNSITAIRKPTLIVQAMDDQVMDASHGRILRQSIPGSVIRILAETGHLIPIERPKELVEALTEHLERAETLPRAHPS